MIKTPVDHKSFDEREKKKKNHQNLLFAELLKACLW